ncbi:MAG: hypothetical protein U9Q20_06390 [Campylobacterota bacterium]|nr:hypothetical protein [Campylobacterota bacterium]
MELIFSLLVVVFFVFLDKVRVGLLGDNNTSSEMMMALSVIVYGFVYSLFV